MLKFRGFKASLNLAYTKRNKDDIENYPTGPENISLAGAYRANREEFFGYGSLSDPPKKITPAMVKLPPSLYQQQPSPTIQPSKSTGDLAHFANAPPAMLRKSTPDVSTDPRGRSTSEDFRTNKPPSKEQKLLERQEKKQQKIAEEKEAKLVKEREKVRQRLEKERAKEQEKAAKKDKPKRERKTKTKAPPLPKSLPPTTVDNPLVILDQLPAAGSQPFLGQSTTTNQAPQVTNQQPKTTDLPVLVIPNPPPTVKPPRVMPQPPPTVSQAPKPTNEPPKDTKEPQKATNESRKAAKEPQKATKEPQKATNEPRKAANDTKQPTAPSRQPKAAQRTNPLGQSSLNYSTDTLDSNISRNTGPPPYEEVMPNTNDKAGNTSFGKRIDDSSNSWDLVSQHRQQMARQMAKERRPKRMVMDLQFDSGFAKDNEENSEV